MWFLGPVIGGVLLSIVGSLVGRVLTALGVGVIAYVGISSSIGWLKTGAVSALLALPPVVVGILSTLQVGSCVSMVFSAMLIRFTLQGMQSDTVKSWVKK